MSCEGLSRVNDTFVDKHFTLLPAEVHFFFIFWSVHFPRDLHRVFYIIGVLLAARFRGNSWLLRRATCCWTLSLKAKAGWQQGHRLIWQLIKCDSPCCPVTNERWLGDRAKESNARPAWGSSGSQGLVGRSRPQKAWRDRDTSVYSRMIRRGISKNGSRKQWVANFAGRLRKEDSTRAASTCTTLVFRCQGSRSLALGLD